MTWALDFIKASSPSFSLDIPTNTHSPPNNSLAGEHTQGVRDVASNAGPDWAVMADAGSRSYECKTLEGAS